MTIQDTITHYHANGWVTIPVEPRSKRALPPNWQNRTLADVKPDTDFQEGMNVGVLLGDNSGGLVDIDLDCPEAIAIAHRYLPETGMIFGRASTPRSHWLYRVENSGGSRKFGHKDTLLEYRATGAQTVFPPSIHPTGEAYVFDKEGEPAIVEKSVLETTVQRIAAACLMARCWHDGQRHDTALALAGSLLRANWPVEEVQHFIESVCIAAHDPEIEDRLAAVVSTHESLNTGQAATGMPALIELIGETEGRKLFTWLGINRSPIEAENNKQPTLAEFFTDSHLSYLFAHEYRGVARFCHEANAWFLWDGKHWAVDTAAKVILLVEEFVKNQISIFAKKVSLDELKRTYNYLSNGKFRSVAELAKSKMPIAKSKLNADPWLFNCENGVLDLRTGALLAHKPELYLSFKASVEFNPEAKCPLFERFVDDIMLRNPEMVAYLQRAAGYSLTGNTSEHCFFLLMGEGRNGKSTLLLLMQHIWGNYARSVAAKTLMENRIEQTPSDIAQLEGKRFAPCSETSNMQRLNEARIKALTGGDEMEARRRYADEYNYTPQFKLWVATNSVPKITGTDEGIWRRIHKIPFDLRLAPEEVDKDLLDKLKAEAPGILNWLLAGALQWQAMKGLNPPDEVKRATEAYREEMDTVRDFISDCLMRAPGSYVNNAQMYSAFKQWHYENAADSSVPGQKELTGRLKQAGYQQKGGRTRRWADVRLVDEDIRAKFDDDLTDEEMEADLEGTPPISSLPESVMSDDAMPY